MQSLCDRVLLLDDGELLHVGEPEEAALRYLRLQPRRSDGAGTARPVTDRRLQRAVIEAGLTDGSGRRIENVEQGRPLRLDALVEARRDMAARASPYRC